MSARVCAGFCFYHTEINQDTLSPHYPYYLSTMSRTLIRFCGTTFLKTAVYRENTSDKWDQVGYITGKCRPTILNHAIETTEAKTINTARDWN